MNTGPNGARKSKRTAKEVRAASSKRTPLLSNLPPPATAARAFSQCLAAIELLEVTCRSPDHQEIGQEQAVLRCAQQAIWAAHDFLSQLQDCSDADDCDAEDHL
jgi:hypothetical protein